MVSAAREEQILAGIRDVARVHLRREGPLDTQARLVEDLGLDSLQLLTLAVEIENRFQICLDEEAEARIRTVGDLVRAVGDELES